MSSVLLLVRTFILSPLFRTSVCPEVELTNTSPNSKETTCENFSEGYILFYVKKKISARDLLQRPRPVAALLSLSFDAVVTHSNSRQVRH